MTLGPLCCCHPYVCPVLARVTHFVGGNDRSQIWPCTESVTVVRYGDYRCWYDDYDWQYTMYPSVLVGTIALPYHRAYGMVQFSILNLIRSNRVVQSHGPRTMGKNRSPKSKAKAGLVPLTLQATVLPGEMGKGDQETPPALDQEAQGTMQHAKMSTPSKQKAADKKKVTGSARKRLELASTEEDEDEDQFKTPCKRPRRGKCKYIDDEAEEASSNEEAQGQKEYPSSEDADVTIPEENPMIDPDIPNATHANDIHLLREIANATWPPSVKISAFTASLAEAADERVGHCMDKLPEWDANAKTFTATPDWHAVGKLLDLATNGAAQQSTPDGRITDLVPSLPGQELKVTLQSTGPQEKDPVPTERYEKNVQLTPQQREEGSCTGVGYVVLVTALSHHVWAIQFVERIDGISKSIYTGTRQQTGTIGCALSCMTPSWYKTKTRMGVRGDATTNDEWFWYRVWQDASKENMDKLVDTLRKNLAEGANQVRTRKVQAGDWQDRRNRDTWLRNWTIEIGNTFDEATSSYVPRPWDTLFTNMAIRSLTTGRFTIFAGMSPEQLIAAGGFFSPTSPYTLRGVMESEQVSQTSDPIHITFTDGD